MGQRVGHVQNLGTFFQIALQKTSATLYLYESAGRNYFLIDNLVQLLWNGTVLKVFVGRYILHHFASISKSLSFLMKY